MDLTWRMTDAPSDNHPQLQLRFGFSSANLIGGKIIVFGGTIGGVGVGRNNYMFVYDIACATWDRIHAEEEELPRRTMHTSVLVKDELLIYGGLDQTGYKRVLLSFDLVLNTWRNIELRGNPPLTSAGHSAEYLEHRDSMIVFVGFNGKYYNDLFEFQLASKVWKKVEAKGEKPSPRFKQGTTLLGFNWFLYGGDTFTGGSSNELFVLDSEPNKPVWSRVKHTESLVPPRLMAPLCVFQGKVVIFKPDTAPPKDRLWMYDPKRKRFCKFIAKQTVDEGGPYNGTKRGAFVIRGEFPSDRRAHMMVSTSKAVLVFGGYNEALLKMYTLLPTQDVIEG